MSKEYTACPNCGWKIRSTLAQCKKCQTIYCSNCAVKHFISSTQCPRCKSTKRYFFSPGYIRGEQK